MRALLTAAVIGAVAAAANATPVPNQVNTFSGGNNGGWVNGDRTGDPPIVTTGGPAGTGDAFLRVTANGGGGAGSRLITLNESTAWTGNFATAGVNAVSMDLKNFGTSPLAMRLCLEESGGTWYISNPAFTLAADNAWHSATFNLTAGGFSLANGGTPFATGMTRIREVRVLDNPSIDFRGAAVSASFGLDNVRAVPEPGTLLVIAVAPIFLRRTLRGTRGFSNHG
jgi:hypothetical protein